MPNPARTTAFPAPNGLQATPARGCGRNFGLFTVKSLLPICGVVVMIPLGNVYLGGRPCASFQPEVNSSRNPMVTLKFGPKRMESSTYNAPIHERQPSGVGEGS